uniref:Uncharacterized protein n=1 Tax=Cryptomonas curvata TaxID=233186 RepID=A0A7S0M2T5_9CRYP|mmetsp:Transcript_22270/g.46776  ORF Transcript_22270/g.46776 Transcript_22270/m.46776 type:complete len:122 (+) Transcript_22270:1-366(+)
MSSGSNVGVDVTRHAVQTDTIMLSRQMFHQARIQLEARLMISGLSGSGRVWKLEVVLNRVLCPRYRMTQSFFLFGEICKALDEFNAMGIDIGLIIVGICCAASYTFAASSMDNPGARRSCE